MSTGIQIYEVKSSEVKLIASTYKNEKKIMFEQKNLVYFVSIFILKTNIKLTDCVIQILLYDVFLSDPLCFWICMDIFRIRIRI